MRDGGRVALERGFPYATVRELIKRGHRVEWNVGSYGGMFATPIINYPEVGILGVVAHEAEIGRGFQQLKRVVASVGIVAAVAASEPRPFTVGFAAETIDVLANDTFGPGASVTGVTDGTDGTVVNNGDGTVSYTPNGDFNGTDSFVYEVSDGAGGSAHHTILIWPHVIAFIAISLAAAMERLPKPGRLAIMAAIAVVACSRAAISLISRQGWVPSSSSNKSPVSRPVCCTSQVSPPSVVLNTPRSPPESRCGP